MFEYSSLDADTSVDVVDFDAHEAASRLHMTRLKRPKSIRGRVTRKKLARPGSMNQRRNKRYF